MRVVLYIVLILSLVDSYRCTDKKNDNFNKKLIALSLYYCSIGDNCKPPPPCSKDCPYLVMDGDNFYGSYNLSINGSTNSLVNYPATVNTIDVDYLLSDSNKNYGALYRRSTFSYSEAVRQKKKIADELSRLKDLAFNSDNQDKAALAQSRYNSLSGYESEVYADFSQVYSNSNNTFLVYDNNSKVEIYAESVYQLQNPTNPPNVANSNIYLKLTNLSAPELNTALTLNSTDTSRYFEITFQGVRYSTKYSGSFVIITLASVPPTKNTALLTITSGTLKSSNSSSLESISISGTMTAYRQ